jgi:hypothetical protein
MSLHTHYRPTPEARCESCGETPSESQATDALNDERWRKLHPHEEIVLCIVCQRERPPKGQMYCEDCWERARRRMKDEEDL